MMFSEMVILREILFRINRLMSRYMVSEANAREQNINRVKKAKQSKSFLYWESDLVCVDRLLYLSTER